MPENEEPQEDWTPEQEKTAADSLRPFVSQLRETLATMADETVLSEEGIALKRLMEMMVVQIEETIFSAEFFVDDMAPDMRAGWEKIEAQAQHLARLDEGDEKVRPILNMAQAMIKTIDAWLAAPKFMLKEEVPTLEARKMLTQSRSLVSKMDGAIAMMEILPNMQGGEQYKHYVERQTMELTAQRDHILKVEGGIVAGLQKRGEKVPKWRRKR